MLSAEENELLTRVGPGTPAGRFMRQYWQPVALAQEVPAGAAPLAVRVLGEDLVLFRRDDGAVGLLEIHCAHRGTDLSYGRVENGGLRCLYHGWLYNTDGTCLEQPGGPPGCEVSVRQRAFPCVERLGMVFAYLGDDEPPPLPAYEFMSLPPERYVATKAYIDCNYLQKKEGNLDPVHLSFLHRDLSNREAILAMDVRPTVEAYPVEFGLRIYAIRSLPSGPKQVRVTNFAFPNVSTHRIGLPENPIWHVPIDDYATWEYNVVALCDADADPSDESWLSLCARWASMDDLEPDYRLRRRRENRYQQDRDEMKDRTFSGMGQHHTVHDAFATETMGRISDRTREHLGPTDRPVIAFREVMLEAIAQTLATGEAPLSRSQDESVFSRVRSVAAEVPDEVPSDEYERLFYDQHAGGVDG